MLRELTKEEITLVSGGTNSEQYFDYYFDFEDTSGFDSWLQSIDFDLSNWNDDNSFTMSIDIYDAGDFDISAYANIGLDDGNFEFQGAGIKITIDF